MELIRLHSDDYEAVLALWNGMPGLGLRPQDDSLEGFTRFLRRNPETCFAARDGGKLVGSILCGHDGRRAAIYHAAVHEQYRGRGIGRALVEKALCALREEGIAKAHLVVFADNEAGNRFWEHLGFHRRDDLVYRDSLVPAARGSAHAGQTVENG